MNYTRFVYSAFVTDVYDGDTITINIDLGFGMKMEKVKLRVFGIDTPELRGPEKKAGIVARDFVRDLILNKNVIIKTHRDKKGKYGRYLGEIFIEIPKKMFKSLTESGMTSVSTAENGDHYLSVSQHLIDNGFAQPYLP